MKAKNFITSGFLLVAVAFTALFITSCSKEDSVKSELSSDDLSNLPFKDLTLSDIEGNNSITMRISSTDASLIEYYTKNNFTIIPIKENQSFSDAVNEYRAKYPSAEAGNDGQLADDNDDLEMLDVIDEPSVNMVIIKKQLSKGIGNVAVTVIAPDFGDERAKFSTRHHYSFNGETKCSIERTAWLHKVQYGLDFKKDATSNWSNVASFPTELSNHDPKLYYYAPCLQYDLTVRARQSNDYTYAFTY